MTEPRRTRALRRADALARVGKAEEARDCLLDLVATSPSDWSIVQAAAELCARTGRTPDATRLYLGMARHFAAHGATARAGQIYDEVLRLSPGDRAATFRRAELAAAAGDRERARTLLAGVVPEADASRGEEPLPALRLGARPADVLAGLAAGRFDDARQALVRLAVKERSPVAEVTGAWLDAAGRSPERVSSLAVALADVCLVAGDPHAGVGILRDFLARVDGDLDALRHLIEIAVEAGAGAVALEAQAALVDALGRSGRHCDALPVAEDLVARLPDAVNRSRLTQVTTAIAAGHAAATGTAPAGDVSGPARAERPTGDARVRDLSDALEALGPR